MADDEIIEITENSEVDDNSDCEIQEDEVPLIEVMASDDEEVCVTRDSVIELDISKTSVESANNNSLTDTDPMFLITFSDEKQFKKLKECIISGIKTSLWTKGIYVDVKESDNFDIFVYKREEPNDEDMKIKDCNKDETNDNNEQCSDNLFLIDTTPTEKIDAGTIPSYKRSIKDALNNEAKKMKKDDECVRPKNANNCFNCFGDHSVKDCPEPRNQSRINKARKQFMETKGLKGDKRYHIDIEQRFAHIRPGRFSDNLRKALGLSSRDLPSFIYKMRILGYPPGWLEDAKVAHSGIALFDSEGRKVLESDDEDGEIENEKHKYDTSKIINFPGFNVEPNFDYFDDYRYYGVPPIQYKDRKEEFIKSLGDNIVKGYKRKRLKDLVAPVEQADVHSEPADMEVENLDKEVIQYTSTFNPPFPPPLPKEPLVEPPPPPPPPPEKLDETCTTPNNDDINILDLRDSPSVEDLEAKRKQLLEALQKSLILDTTGQDDSVIEVLELTNEESEMKQTGNSEIATATAVTTTTANSNLKEAEREAQTTLLATTTSDQQSNSEDNDSDSNTPKTPGTKTLKKCTILGTPVLKFSPYEKLPEGDQFKKGVSDVINFENLPDSTGKYEKIKVIIQKVRSIVTKLNDEN